MPESQTKSDVSARHIVEFLIAFGIVATLMRTFIAEAYLVPSGSMAPRLMGFHKKPICPSCGFKFEIGIEPEEEFPFSAKMACPVCGRKEIDLDTLPINSGDRVLVQKGVYDLRAPRRWESIVFHHPEHIRQPYVKRVVALPGETVQIKHGDIYINGKIERKSLEEFLAMCIPVSQSDDEHAPMFIPLQERWGLESQLDAANHTKWTIENKIIVGESDTRDQPSLDKADKHGQLAFLPNGPGKSPLSVEDDLPYNARRDHWKMSDVTDLLVRGRLRSPTLPLSGALTFDYQALPGHVFSLTLDYTRRKSRVLNDGKIIAEREFNWSDGVNISFAFGVIDRRLIVRLNDGSMTMDQDLDEIGTSKSHFTATMRSPFRFNLEAGTSIQLLALRVDRDVHYSDKTTGAHHGHGVTWPTKLKSDEYFVLGDNSSISNDSRTWDYPGVAHKLLIGKPILIHLPTKATKSHLLGRDVQYSLPDFSRIRVMK